MTKRGVLVTAAAVIIVSMVALVLWARGRRDVVVSGTLQWGFEESAFFPDSDCSKKPYWWKWPNGVGNDLDARWKALGKPAAVRVTVRGNLSAFGLHGHLGAYRREVQPTEIVSVGAASRCQWWWGK